MLKYHWIFGHFKKDNVFYSILRKLRILNRPRRLNFVGACALPEKNLNILVPIEGILDVDKEILINDKEHDKILSKLEKIADVLCNQKTPKKVFDKYLEMETDLRCKLEICQKNKAILYCHKLTVKYWEQYIVYPKIS